MPNKIMPLADAVARNVRDGQTIAMEGFTHLIPFAAGHEVIRQGRKNLKLIRMTPDILYDQLIGMGCATGLVFSWGGNPGVGSIHASATRSRTAGRMRSPSRSTATPTWRADTRRAHRAALLRVARLCGSDLPKHNPNIRSIRARSRARSSPRRRPSTRMSRSSTQRADREGNVMITGIVGIQKECVLAAKAAIVTVEEIVDDLEAPMNACFLPHWALSAVCEVPRGAHPSYAHGYYGRDNAFCKSWDAISRERETFLEWMKKHVLGTKTHAEYMKSAGIA
jgi:glutaconate CoA-transferase subunit A